MPYPNWQPGMTITAARLNAMQPIIAVKSSNQQINNSAVLVDAAGLGIPVDANAVYIMDGFLHWTGDVNADIRLAFSYPSGTTVAWGLTGAPNPNDIAYNNGQDKGTVVARYLPAAGTGDIIIYAATGMGTVLGGRLSGTVVTGGTAGTVQLRFAQGTQHSSTLTLLQRSWISLRRVQ